MKASSPTPIYGGSGRFLAVDGGAHVLCATELTDNTLLSKRRKSGDPHRLRKNSGTSPCALLVVPWGKTGERENNPHNTAHSREGGSLS